MRIRFSRPRHGLAREITALLVVKAALLMMLWRLFFADAPMTGASGVADALLGASAPHAVVQREDRR